MITPRARSENPSVVILGGGPAGGFAALELAQANFNVVLLERQSSSHWKIGETLPPESRIHLQRLGYWRQFQSQGHLPCHGIVSVWGAAEPIEKDFIFNPCGHGWQLDRARFESELLAAAAAAGCDVQFGAELVGIEKDATGWKISTSTRALRSDWIIDCTGRQGSIVNRFGRPYTQLDSLVSVFAVASTASDTDRDARTYVESVAQGWLYSALMPNGSRSIAFQTDRDQLLSDSPTAAWLWERLAAAPHIHRLLRTHGYDFETPRVVAAHSGRFERCAGARWIAVGDAAMTFDPLSGQGTAKALDSAHHAVRAIQRQEDYQAHCDQLWSQFLRDRRDYYSAEPRFADAHFWSRRHGC
jgi:2-polyprenyl-6-methoxyphenol hydroxylase-like FAD-dependent oxidoreductase